MRLHPAALPEAGHVRLDVPGGSIEIPVLDARVAVIGSGAAGLNAAVHAAESGMDAATIVIITDEWGGGTSYNSGSDKQTYYKLSIAGEGTDSPIVMARDLFDGGSMHGDIALAEAAGSIEEFFHLVRIGVEFPRTELGMYPGYQTDNDTRQRATSVGPYTSREMVEALAREAARLGIGMLDGHVAMRILVDNKARATRVVGVACFKRGDHAGVRSPIKSSRDLAITIIRAPAVILATGGPANIYSRSAYPAAQRCSLGLGIEAGATMQNLPFMQYGIASSKFRWNLSGSFQQVIPSYWVKGESHDEKVELLHEWLPSVGDIAYQTFLKGYHWPFNPAKCNPGAINHSSIIDLAIHEVTIMQGKRVFMDFRMNPWDLLGAQFSVDDLPAEARGYLEASGAMQSSPIKRLEALNPFAIEVYADHGISLKSEAIEVHVAAQHCNGGFTGDVNWESPRVRGLYPVGEANGSHGQHRPGGAALNAGQVGGLRAARHLASLVMVPSPPSLLDVEHVAQEQLVPVLARLHVGKAGGVGIACEVDTALAEIRHRMASAGGIVRSIEGLRKARDEAKVLVEKLDGIAIAVETREVLGEYLAARDAAITHHAILAAMAEQLANEPGVHPCYVVASEDGEAVRDIVGRQGSFSTIEKGTQNRLLETQVLGSRVEHAWIDARPVPDVKGSFEAALQRRRRD